MAEPEVRRRAILLDIEGTVTPISYVYDTLFPYARIHGPRFIREHWNEGAVRGARADLFRSNEADRIEGAPLFADSSLERQMATMVDYYLWLMERDRKVPGLKAIQGLVWEQGFRDGELRSEVFADVRPALERWRAGGRLVAIYSSGSVLAQQNVFRHSNQGDLTPFIYAYFDTQVGSKRDLTSYQKIAGYLDCAPVDILFASDSLDELNGAASAGFETRLSIRPGNAAIAIPHNHESIETLAAIS